MTIKCFNQDFHLFVVVGGGHDIVGISDLKYVDVGSNLNRLIILHGLVKNPADDLIEESR